MKNASKVFLILFALLKIAFFAVIYFGTNYEISQLQPEIRSKMSDFDWIGVRWIGFGIMLFGAALISSVLSLIIYFFKNKLTAK